MFPKIIKLFMSHEIFVKRNLISWLCIEYHVRVQFKFIFYYKINSSQINVINFKNQTFMLAIKSY